MKTTTVETSPCATVRVTTPDAEKLARDARRARSLALAGLFRGNSVAVGLALVKLHPLD